MKKLMLIMFVLISCKTTAQEMSDSIFTKEGDVVICKITEIQKHWIYYDYKGKKKIKNTYIHIDDIGSYTYNGVVNKSKEKELKEMDMKNRKNYNFNFLPLPVNPIPPFIPPSPVFFGH